MAIKGYNQKYNKRNQKQNNHYKIGYVLPEDVSKGTLEEVLEILSTTKFNKISFPVSTYRYYMDGNTDMNDTRVITVGYIKNFDAEKGVFTIVLFNNNRLSIDEFTNPTLEVVFSEYNGSLGCITKFNIIDLPEDDEEEDTFEYDEEDPTSESTYDDEE